MVNCLIGLFMSIQELERRVNELEWKLNGNSSATAVAATAVAVKQDSSAQTDPIQPATEEPGWLCRGI